MISTMPKSTPKALRIISSPYPVTAEAVTWSVGKSAYSPVRKLRIKGTGLPLLGRYSERMIRRC